MLKRQINWQLIQTEELEEYRFQPQLLVRYQINGTQVENWIDAGPETDQMGVPRAQALVAELPTAGDSITCWYDENDPSTIEFQIGDGGRQTWLIGIALGAFTLMPGLGMILAAWLLRRLP